MIKPACEGPEARSNKDVLNRTRATTTGTGAAALNFDANSNGAGGSGVNLKQKLKDSDIAKDFMGTRNPKWRERVSDNVAFFLFFQNLDLLLKHAIGYNDEKPETSA